MVTAERKQSFISVRGKVCFVTGASSGLGREIALRMAKEGADVVVAARRVGKLHEVCREIESLDPPGCAKSISLDVSADEEHIDKAVAKAWSAFGRIDILVNNAGVAGPLRSPLEVSQAEWDRSLNTNARGAWLVSKAVARRAIADGGGGVPLRLSVINIASIAGLDKNFVPGATHYAASKAAMIQVTKTMAMELGPQGIRFNAIAAGLFESEMTEHIFRKDWIEETARRILPLQRWGKADPDFTSSVIFLASDAASYITGTTIIVDGGQTLVRPRLKSSL